MYQLTSREEYLELLDDIIDEHDEWVDGDPIAVANGMIGSIERIDDVRDYVRTYGNAQVDSRTLYPLDVITYSRQPVDEVERYRREQTDRVDDPDLDVYAIYTMALDLQDRSIERSRSGSIES